MRVCRKALRVSFCVTNCEFLRHKLAVCDAKTTFRDGLTHPYNICVSAAADNPQRIRYTLFVVFSFDFFAFLAFYVYLCTILQRHGLVVSVWERELGTNQALTIKP